ncbi:MAG TPA: sigma-54 dependent transcriptional regulator [Candidatus Polarisedimenticolia bacterium]|nr:sigma-54 dependent transcriptional regulator [Candidatus Polarisedimenticolia bacterium]
MPRPDSTLPRPAGEPETDPRDAGAPVPGEERPVRGVAAGAPLEAGAESASPPERRRRSDLLIGSSPAMARVTELIAVAARTEIPVLILGESGTGKELVARAVHYTGTRAARPFITVNCGAIPETLMEDELFGHARGAYTGAHGDKKGVFEEAEGGSLFLDEIGDLYPSCQVKLLRVLQEQEVRRLGETRSRRVNVRIMAATNRDLKREMAEKRFREDLFHRISVLPIALPPLRERRDDVPLLVDHFVRRFNQELARSIEGFTPRAVERLKVHPWPGNVRELENRVKQAMVMAKEDLIDTESLALFSGQLTGADLPPFRKAKAEFEKSYVVQALRLTAGKVSAAARLAGKDRKDFYDLMKKHAIDPDEFRH